MWMLAQLRTSNGWTVWKVDAYRYVEQVNLTSLRDGAHVTTPQVSELAHDWNRYNHMCIAITPNLRVTPHSPTASAYPPDPHHAYPPPHPTAPSDVALPASPLVPPHLRRNFLRLRL